MRQKDIYYAKLDPIVGREQAGKRPVVIISGNEMNKFSDLCIVCPLTGQIRSYPSSVKIPRNKMNQLPLDSEAMSHQVRTISKFRFGRKLGKITEEQLAEIFYKLGEVLHY